MSYEAVISGLSPSFRWRLDGSSAEDGGHNTNTSGTITWAGSIIPQVAGQCWQSNGTARINPSNSSLINVDSRTERRSVSLWFSSDTISGTQARNIYEEGGGTHGWNVTQYGSDLLFNITQNKSSRAHVAFSGLEIGAVYHVLAVFNLLDQSSGANVELFVNGISAGTANYTVQNYLNSHSGDIQIGERGDGREPAGYSSSETPFEGRIQDVCYWSEITLTAADALAIYQAGVGWASSDVSADTGQGASTGQGQSPSVTVDATVDVGGGTGGVQGSRPAVGVTVSTTSGSGVADGAGDTAVASADGSSASGAGQVTSQGMSSGVGVTTAAQSGAGGATTGGTNPDATGDGHPQSQAGQSTGSGAPSGVSADASAIAGVSGGAGGGQDASTGADAVVQAGKGAAGAAGLTAEVSTRINLPVPERRTAYVLPRQHIVSVPAQSRRASVLAQVRRAEVVAQPARFAAALEQPKRIAVVEAQGARLATVASQSRMAHVL